MTKKIYTVIATFETEEAEEEVRSAAQAAVAMVKGHLIPTGWAPDMDSLEEASDLEFGSVTLLDMNPGMNE